MKNEREAMTTAVIDINRIIEEYYEQLNTHKFDNADDMDQYLERQTTKTHTHKNRQSE